MRRNPEGDGDRDRSVVAVGRGEPNVGDLVLLPSGIAPGDDIEIGIWWRAMSDPRYLRVWLVWEPPLSTVE